MNWVFETYSNVYGTAMMQDMKFVAPAKKTSTGFKATIARIIGRR
jgi:hypothetical protein